MTRLDTNIMFDMVAFDNRLAACTTNAERIQLFRQTVANLDDHFNQRFIAGEPIEDLISGRAWVTDEILLRAWGLFFEKDIPDIALVAVGGYGRGELHPQSDIDIMVLLRKHNDTRFNPAVQQFLTFLWDVRFEVGHSVRSLKDCVIEGKADITVATNLMEARLLTGSTALFEKMQHKTGPAKIWPSRKFFAAKWEEQIDRHHKFNDTAYNLEPNVKEGPGGLRDIQVIGWVAKRHFGASTLHDLVTHGFLTHGELVELLEGQAYLWKIRYALHMITKHPENKILFDHQTEIAKLFGFQDTHIIAVEQFMQSYYQTVMKLQRLNEMLLQHFQESILYPRRRRKIKPIDDEFQRNLDFIEVTRDDVFKKNPPALLRIFLVLEQSPDLIGVRASTIRLIRDHLHLIDDEFRQSPEARKLFIRILREPHGITHELRRMNRYGVLAAYLPEFANIVGRMQYDLFHHFTVDEHTLFVVRNMRRLTVPEFRHEHPFCSDLIDRLPKPELLYISGLYHDIAKGRGGDHSELGAIDATNFCRNHGLSDYDSRLVAWLVGEHLLMSTTAQRKDISDPSVINDFANQVGDKLHLDYLYLLTVCDMRATNPDLYNSWKKSLLEELYRSTRDALQRGLNNPLVRQERIDDNKNAAMESLLRPEPEQAPLDKKAIETLWANISPGYFSRHYPEEISWHTRLILTTPESGLPVISIYPDSMRGSTAIFIYIQDRDYLFFNITSQLEQLDLDIVDARITTTLDGRAMNTFMVLEGDGKRIKSKMRKQQIVSALKKQLAADSPAPRLVERRASRQMKFMDVKTRIRFEVDKKGERTVLRVWAADRPGLLSRIAQAFRDGKIRLKNARITTFGEVAEDTFIITDEHGEPITDDNMKQQLETSIRRYLDQ